MSKIIDWSKAPEWAQELSVNPYNEKAWLGDEGYSYLVGNGGVVPWSHETAFARTAFKNIEDRPAPWTGEGLPPVGTIIELCDVVTVPLDEYDHNEHCIVDTWRNGDRLEVIAHKNVFGTDGVIVFNIARMQASALRAGLYKAIRTPEQIAEEEREAKAKAMYLSIYFAEPADNWDRMPESARETFRKAIDAGWQQVAP